MGRKYVLALDQGTTSSRAIVFDDKANIAGAMSREYRQIYPKPGWVEHDPHDIINSQMTAIKGAIENAGIAAEDISSIGIANQRETVLLWDRNTGKPVYNAIVWQCRRTSNMCMDLKINGVSEIVRDKTGLVLDAYFSATKIKWILDNIPGVREEAQKGNILAGTIDTWLIWNLTGGKVHATDYSNASRTMLFNIKTLTWDDELLGILDIPKCILAEVKPTSGMFGLTDKSILDAEIPITAAVGDQQAALFGQACFEKGSAKNTYGTGCFLLMNTGRDLIASRNNLLTTIAWGIGNEIEYALEGSIFTGGAVVQWLRDELGIIKTAAECDELAESVDSTNGVYFVPAFVGLGTPYWDMYARGALLGLTRGTNRTHIARAALEAIAYQVVDVLNCMKDDAVCGLKYLKVDGGASVSDFLMRFQANMLNTPVYRPKVIETTALGAAFLAGLQTGVWADKKEVESTWAADRVFQPKMSEKNRKKLYKGWKKAVERSLKWEDA